MCMIDWKEHAIKSSSEKVTWNRRYFDAEKGNVKKEDFCKGAHKLQGPTGEWKWCLSLYECALYCNKVRPSLSLLKAGSLWQTALLTSQSPSDGLAVVKIKDRIYVHLKKNVAFYFTEDSGISAVVFWWSEVSESFFAVAYHTLGILGTNGNCCAHSSCIAAPPVTQNHRQPSRCLRWEFNYCVHS